MVLLDEIEKAHPDVCNMLLQIMEEGRLTDNFGRMVDFKNTIIIMTTNIGAARSAGEGAWLPPLEQRIAAGGDGNQGEGGDQPGFNPEFLNRLDDTIVFRPLTTSRSR